MFFASLSLLSALPLAFAAPTCSVRPASSGVSSAAPSAPSSASNPSSGGSSNSSTGAGTGGKIAMAWWANWRSQSPVSNISWAHYTHMAFFSVQPSASGTIEVNVDDSTVQEFVSAAQANNVKPILTVGGWSDSIYWSSSVATTQNRSTLANSLAQYAHQHGFTGLDFDWEYPGKQAIGCNIVSPNDAANFLSFLQEMRQVASNLTLSAATSVHPWDGPDGTALTDVSSYASALDWIEIMNYDVYGTFSSVTGPNSPLNDTCAATSNQQGSAVSAVSAWTQANFPANKIVLGVASYGHSFTVQSSTAVTGSALNIYTSFDKTNIPAGDSWDPASTSPDICGNPPVGNGNSGIWHYWALVENGFIDSDGSPAHGMVGRYDDCSQTPFVYNPSTSVLVSYDDPQSFTAKGQYIQQTDLAGFAMYEAGGDYNDDLKNAIVTAMG